MHEMQTIVTDVRGVCLSRGDYSMQPLSNHLGPLFCFLSDNASCGWHMTRQTATTQKLKSLILLLRLDCAGYCVHSAMKCGVVPDDSDY